MVASPAYIPLFSEALVSVWDPFGYREVPPWLWFKGGAVELIKAFQPLVLIAGGHTTWMHPIRMNL